MVITDDKIVSFGFSKKYQILILLFVGFLISWASFSSGKYFTFRKILEHKEAEIYQANLINLDLQTRIDSLQGNLVRLNSYFDTVKNFDHNKNKLNKNFKKKDKTSSLNQINNERNNFDKKRKVLANINNNTIDRIKKIEDILQIAGIPLSTTRDKQNKNSDKIRNIDNIFANQGGPNTEKIFDIDYKETDIDDQLYFAENVSRLFFLENLVNTLPFRAPMQKYYISSFFGSRFDPFYDKVNQHFGIDFAGPLDSEIYSTSPGVVKFSGRKGNYGNLIEIDHGYKVTTRYGHLKSLKVKQGDLVKRGQLIAIQGNTGRSSGPHLHYEVRYMNKPYNPINFLKAGKYVF